MICVSLGSVSSERALQLCKEVKLVEIRADLLNWTRKEYSEILSSGVKSIFTCRPGYIADKERLDLFEFAAKAGATYIDIEFESENNFRENLMRILKKYNNQLIISYHNFEGTPEKGELESILEECYLKSADVAKIACRVYSQADVAKLLSLYEISGRKVVIGMGASGRISRIAAVLLGAEFTFASPGAGSETADGQFDYKTMEEILNLINN